MQEPPRDEESRTTLRPTEARSGRRGLPVVIVLVAALLALMIFWVPVEWFGEATDPPAGTTSDNLGNPAGGEAPAPEPTETPASATEEPGEGTGENAPVLEPEAGLEE